MKEGTAYIYEFETFRLDPERKSLWRADELVPLTPKAFETLLVLVRNSGEVVEKRELMDAVWPDTFVEESTLSQNILTLRKTLGGLNEGKQFIATVPRRGFRFVAPVRMVQGAGRCSNGDRAEKPAEQGAQIAFQKPDSSNTRQERSVSPVLLVAGILIVAATGLAWYLSRPALMADSKFREFRIASLLTDSHIRAATVSPDGKYLSLIESRGDTERMLVRQVGEADAIEVVPPTDRRFLGASFSPDSQYVFYTVYRSGDAGVRVGELLRVPLLGGPSQPIASDVDSAASISRSGKLAFVRRRPAEGNTMVVTADLDGRNQNVISTRKLEDVYINASLSPDGGTIVAAANSSGNLTRPMELVLIDAASGVSSSLTSQPWLWIGRSAWLADGSGVVVVGYGAMSPDLTDEVWLVSVPDGRARMLNAGMNGVFGISVTEDGNSIVAVRSDKITSFVISPLADLSKEQAIVTKAGDQSLLPLGLDWSRDGRILYSTTDNGNADVWSINADGSDRNRLTADKYADLQPQASSDGQYLYFLSNRSGQMSVWRSRADGTEAQKLTEGSDAFSVTPSPDGRFIYYTARADSVFSQHLWRADADGKNAVKLTSKTTLQPRISPDGKTIACYSPSQAGGPLLLSLLNAETGELIRQFPERKNDLLLEWLKNGRELLVVSRNGSGSAASKLSIETGGSVILREWPNESVFRVALSPGGDRLVYEKGVSANNIVLLSSAN